MISCPFQAFLPVPDNRKLNNPRDTHELVWQADGPDTRTQVAEQTVNRKLEGLVNVRSSADVTWSTGGDNSDGMWVKDRTWRPISTTFSVKTDGNLRRGALLP